MDQPSEETVVKGRGRGFRAAIWVLSVLLVLGLAGFLSYRHFTSIRIIPVTQREVDEIVGPDLRWTPTSIAGPTVSETEMSSLAKDPLTAKVVGFMYVRPWRPLDHATDIRNSRRITDALKRAIAGRSLVVKGPGDDFPMSFAAFRTLAKLYAIQIELGAAEKDFARCFRLSTGALEFNRFLARSLRSNLVDVLVAGAVDEILLTAIEKAASTGIFAPEQLRALYSGIEPAPEEDVAFANAVRADFSHEVSAYLTLQSKKEAMEMLFSFGSSWMDDPEADRSDLDAGELNLPKTLRRAAEIAREIIANCSRPWSRHSVSVLTQLETDSKLLPEPPDIKTGDSWLKRTWEKAKFKAKMRAIPNALGLVALSSFGPTTDHASVSFRHRTIAEAHRLALLIQLYREVHRGALPDRLDQLRDFDRSGHLPLDMYAGGPFHFDAKRRIYWSVGENGVDDGGTGGANRYKSPDIVWAIL
ncbi:MAG: hypothetical protein ACHQ50_08865 [Fimbriimonadales bacterium]